MGTAGCARALRARAVKWRRGRRGAQPVALVGALGRNPPPSLQPPAACGMAARDFQALPPPPTRSGRAAQWQAKAASVPTPHNLEPPPLRPDCPPPAAAVPLRPTRAPRAANHARAPAFARGKSAQKVGAEVGARVLRTNTLRPMARPRRAHRSNGIDSHPPQPRVTRAMHEVQS